MAMQFETTAYVSVSSFCTIDQNNLTRLAQSLASNMLWAGTTCGRTCSALDMPSRADTTDSIGNTRHYAECARRRNLLLSVE